MNNERSRTENHKSGTAVRAVYKVVLHFFLQGDETTGRWYCPRAQESTTRVSSTRLSCKIYNRAPEQQIIIITIRRHPKRTWRKSHRDTRVRYCCYYLRADTSESTTQEVHRRTSRIRCRDGFLGQVPLVVEAAARAPFPRPKVRFRNRTSDSECRRVSTRFTAKVTHDDAYYRVFAYHVWRRTRIRFPTRPVPKLYRISLSLPLFVSVLAHSPSSRPLYNSIAARRPEISPSARTARTKHLRNRRDPKNVTASNVFRMRRALCYYIYLFSYREPADSSPRFST